MQEKKWSEIIKPKKGLFQLNFRELWDYRDLIYLFVRRDFVSKYKQTILGPLWFIIQPLLTTLMFVVVFGNIAGISTDGLPKILFYFSGLVGWNYFSISLTATSNVFVTNANIFGKVYFPRLSLPISIVISSLIQFFIQFIFLLLFIFYFSFNGFEFDFNYHLFLLPLLIIVLAGLSLGFGIIISSLTTKYRDLTYLVTFGVQLFMYATPVIYPLSSLSGTYKYLIELNPLTSIIEAFRFIMLGVGDLDYFNLLYSALFMIITLFFGVIIFNKVEQSFMDTV
jgi:lipopolysaccharide transport system permease protein